MLHFYFIPHLLTIDPSLGRLDYDSLSDQALMEMLISGMTTEYKQVFQDENGHYVDVCDWKTFGFTNIGCTDARVTAIKVATYAFNDAQFPFEFIPPLVQSFWMMDCNLHGTLNPSNLPQNILKFDVGGNALDGSIDCKGFPKSIESIILFENAFSGSLALSHLLDSVVSFEAPTNKLSGELTLDALPLSMEVLILSQNNFSGPIFIKKLPNGMNCLDLSRNSFSGEFRLLVLPPSLEKIDISENDMKEKEVLLSTYGDMHFELVHSSIELVVDEQGEKHPWEEKILDSRYSDSDED